jgi:hypothetical protein
MPAVPGGATSVDFRRLPPPCTAGSGGSADVFRASNEAGATVALKVARSLEREVTVAAADVGDA